MTVDLLSVTNAETLWTMGPARLIAGGIGTTSIALALKYDIILSYENET